MEPDLRKRVGPPRRRRLTELADRCDVEGMVELSAAFRAVPRPPRRPGAPRLSRGTIGSGGTPAAVEDTRVGAVTAINRVAEHLPSCRTDRPAGVV